jgi:hypothetical protein
MDIAKVDQEAVSAASLMGGNMQQPRQTAAAPVVDGPPKWETVIMHGGATETKSFPMPDEAAGSN